jgi:hypothetical protein
VHPSGERGILVGYSEDSKAYRVFLSDQHKTMVSQDVKFEENLASRKLQDLPAVAEETQEVAQKMNQEQRLPLQGASLKWRWRSSQPLRLQSGGPGGLSRPCGMLESMLKLHG